MNALQTISGLRCSGCGSEHWRADQRYCVNCHNAYMRAWRRTHPLTAEQRFKDNARSMANVYLRRGKILRANCVLCSEPHAQMHHPDYSRPLDVIWMCRDCHMALHRFESEVENGMAYEGVNERLAELSGLQDGWLDARTKRPSSEALAAVRDFFRGANIVPMSNGGLQVEWHQAGMDVECEFGPDGQLRGAFVGRAAPTKSPERAA